MTAEADSACAAILLLGFGGPNSPEEIRPFLDRVLRGRPVPRDRYEEVVHHYEMLGGRSPYNELMMRQATALRTLLSQLGVDVPIVVGLRNTPPYIEDALRELGGRGIKRALGLVLAAHRCEASWERYQNDVAEARERVGAASPMIVYPTPWHDHPLFIEAVVDRVSAAIARFDDDERDRIELVFTAHSIPTAMAARAPYVDQLNESARLITEALRCQRWTLAFQSRSGSPREPWLEPDIGDVLRKVNGRAALVVPLGFLCDHVEVLYDIDIAFREFARKNAMRLWRAESLNGSPTLTAALADIALFRLKAAAIEARA
jgi:protoporphyrin/coproporphyrin ferrochelatase